MNTPPGGVPERSSTNVTAADPTPVGQPEPSPPLEKPGRLRIVCKLWCRRMRRRLRRWARALQFAAWFIGIPIGLALTKCTAESTYVVNAVTEEVTFTVDSVRQPTWSVAGAQLFEDGRQAPLSLSAGIFRPARLARVSMSRVGQGRLTVNVVGNGSAGNLFDQNSEPVHAFGASVTFVWDSLAQKSHNVVVSFFGDVFLENLGTGPEQLERNPALLRNGSISMLRRSLWPYNDEIGEVGSVVLSPGDSIALRPSSAAYGFVVADERPALTVALRVDASEARVTPAGGTTRSVNATFLDVLRKDSGIQLWWIIVGFLIGLGQLIGRLRPNRKEPSS